MGRTEVRSGDSARSLSPGPSYASNGIDRAGPGDLMTLASDHGAVPMNIGAILLLDRGSDLDIEGFTAAIGSRIGTVPRLRQRLVRSPLGCGRPVWLDDPEFDLAHHLSAGELAAPASRAGLLELAASLACTRLDLRRPLWAARLVPGLEGGHAALVIVLHHALADGIGGLAVLAALADGPAEQRRADFPARPPSRPALARDALSSRTAALVRAPGAVRAWAGGIRELGLVGGRPILAPATSLNRATGGRRRLSTVQLPTAEVVVAAHRHHCTVNDVLLAAVTGALATVLRSRGEHPKDLVVSVPVSTRRAATAVELGNHTGVAPMRIITSAARGDRLRQVAALTRTWRDRPRGRSAGPLAAGFRLLAALRLFQPFANHQRFVNTFLTNVKGPVEPVDIAGHRVLEVIPVAMVPGNVGVAFAALSYADRLVVTLGADPMVVPDQELLTAALAAELELLVRPDLPSLP